MGVCISKNGPNKRRKSKEGIADNDKPGLAGQRYPLTSTYSGVLTKQEQLLFKVQKNNLLKFHLKISNIKAKNLPKVCPQ